MNLQRIMLSGKKPISKGYILHNSIYNVLKMPTLKKCRRDEWLPEVKDGGGGGVKYMWLYTGSRDHMVMGMFCVFWVCVNVNILAVTCTLVLKMLPLGQLGKAFRGSLRTISYESESVSRSVVSDSLKPNGL